MKKIILIAGGFLFLYLTVFAARIEKALLYKQHTLQDTYKYQEKERNFQWKKISGKIDTLIMLEEMAPEFGALNNYKNRNGVAPLADSVKQDAYKAITDKHGVRRDQAIPFYRFNNLSVPECYGRDGALVWILRDTADYLVIVAAPFRGIWLVPAKYVDRLPERYFRKLLFVDRTNQNITTLEQSDTAWLVRSMNPVTTGVERPPHRFETPAGIYVIRSKQTAMLYLKDGKNELDGFAPWASRFSGGAYTHSVPVKYPNKKTIEYSWSLGTTKRSHMCVRNATSHAKFIYDWAPVDVSLVYVFD